MDLISPERFAYSMLFTLLIASLLGMLWAWVWALGRTWKGLPLLVCVRARPLRRPPWGGLSVLSLVFLYLGVNIAVTGVYAAATGRHLPRLARAAENQGGAREPVRTTDQPRAAEKAPPPKEAAADGESNDVKAEMQAPRPEAPLEQSLAELMFQSAVSNGLLLLLVPALVRLTSGAGLEDLGLYWKQWPQQIGIGVRAAMLMTPAVCAIQFLAIHVWRSHTHPVEQMVHEKLTLGVAILAVLSTMVLAPWIEELLFRGVLQRWLGRFALDRSMSCTTSPDDEWPTTLESGNEPFPSDTEYALPKSTQVDPGRELFDSGYLPAEQPWSHSSNLPILFTSILFAAMHLPQWPAPIAIFLLSMALGAVYQRTGSLLASITMHATFNGINTLLLLLAALGPHIQPPIQPVALTLSTCNLLTDVIYFISFR